MEAAKNWTYIQGKGSRRWSRPDVSLGRIYDEDGNRHVWNLFVIEKVDGKPTRIEVKASDIAKGTE
jgi:hypothetical protein